MLEGMQSIFESLSWPLLKSGVGPLARYGIHQEIISRRFEQMYTSSHTRLDGPGMNHYWSRTQIIARGPKRYHCSTHLPDHY